MCDFSGWISGGNKGDPPSPTVLRHSQGIALSGRSCSQGQCTPLWPVILFAYLYFWPRYVHFQVLLLEALHRDLLSPLLRLPWWEEGRRNLRDTFPHSHSEPSSFVPLPFNLGSIKLLEPFVQGCCNSRTTTPIPVLTHLTLRISAIPCRKIEQDELGLQTLAYTRLNSFLVCCFNQLL